MTLRAYLTILRPVRTLLLTAFYGWAMGFNLLRVFANLPRAEALFFTSVLLGPLILGSFLTGPLHEVMHRNFSVVLPGARRSLRRWHVGAVALAAAGCFAGSTLTRMPFPPVAALGLILGCLTLPLLNRRRALGAAYFLGMGGYLALGVFVALPSRMLLVTAAEAQPWVFLAAGGGLAALCFRIGFAAENVRERSRNPQLVCTFQTTFPLLGSGGFALARYAQHENARVLAARKAGRTTREWSRAAVGDALRDWTAVLHHCRFGGTKVRQLLLGLMLIGASPLAIVLLFQLSLSRVRSATASPAGDFGTMLASAFRAGSTPDLISSLFYASALHFGLVAITSFTASFAFAS